MGRVGDEGCFHGRDGGGEKASYFIADDGVRFGYIPTGSKPSGRWEYFSSLGTAYSAPNRLALHPVGIRVHYLISDTDRFVALMQRRSLAGFHFEPMPPLRVRDRYLDTTGADLLAAGHSLRLRSQEGTALATLRSLDGSTDVSERLAEPAALPPRVREAVGALVGGANLETLLAFRQYRTPRGVYDGRRLVGVLSLDAVTDDSTEVLESWTEVEVELAANGTPEDLRRLDRDLVDVGFEAVARSKFERALFRLGRDADGPLYLLPDERAALEAFRTSESSVQRRRAEVLLLAAEGLPTRQISFKASLSPSRVRHWKHAFRHERMGVFDADVPERDTPAPAPERRGFRVSEVVEPPAADEAAARRTSVAELEGVLDAVIDGAHRHPGTPFLHGDE